MSSITPVSQTPPLEFFPKKSPPKNPKHSLALRKVTLHIYFCVKETKWKHKDFYLIDLQPPFSFFFPCFPFSFHSVLEKESIVVFS